MVGALLGSLVPQSEAEEEALRDLAGNVRSTATGLAQQVVDRGSEAAGKLVEGVRDSAESRGLSGNMSITEVVKKAGSGELLGSAKAVALDALKVGEDAVRDKASSEPSDDRPGSPQAQASANTAGAQRAAAASPTSSSAQPVVPPQPAPKTAGG